MVAWGEGSKEPERNACVPLVMERVKRGDGCWDDGGVPAEQGVGGERASLSLAAAAE